MNEFNITLNGKWNEENELAVHVEIKGVATSEVLNRAYLRLGNLLYRNQLKEHYDIEEGQAEEKFKEILGREKVEGLK